MSKPSPLVAHLAPTLLGVSAGLRSMTPLAVAAWFARDNHLRVKRTWAAWLAHPAAVTLLTAAAFGEYVGDKLPNTPNRTEPLGLVGRLAFGATAGAVVAAALHRKPARGIVLGALGALAGTFGGFYLRRSLTHNAGLPDLPVALTGDAAAVALAVRSLQRLTT